jgi:hypothetical protein
MSSKPRLLHPSQSVSMDLGRHWHLFEALWGRLPDEGMRSQELVLDILQALSILELLLRTLIRPLQSLFQLFLLRFELLPTLLLALSFALLNRQKR